MRARRTRTRPPGAATAGTAAGTTAAGTTAAGTTAADAAAAPDTGTPLARTPVGPPAGRPPTRRAICGWLAVVLALLVAAGAEASSSPAGAVPTGAVPAATPADGAPEEAASSPAAVRYRAPVTVPVRLLRPFVAPAQPWAPGHRGVDLALGEGGTVVAPAAGTVVVAGTVVDRGVVTIRHPDGRRSSLEPVRPSVVVGQAVAAGEAVGTLADERSHCSPRCLHWGVREGTAYVDPLGLLLGGGPVVLLPDGG